jgi:hypothetical protein
MSTDELRNCALAKSYPRLWRAFEDLGLDVSGGRLAIMHKQHTLQTIVGRSLNVESARRFIHIVNGLACARALLYHPAFRWCCCYILHHDTIS